MSTHNLRFRAKIRKIGLPLYTPIVLYKMGFKGVFIARTCYPDASDFSFLGHMMVNGVNLWWGMAQRTAILL